MKHTKRCDLLKEMFYILSHWEMKIKTTLRFHLTSEWPRSIKQMIPHASNDAEKGKHLFIAGESANWPNNYENECGGSPGIMEWIYLKIQLYHS